MRRGFTLGLGLGLVALGIVLALASQEQYIVGLVPLNQGEL